MADALQQSRNSGAHNLLNRMVGSWRGTAKVWFEPEKLADESPTRGQVRSVLEDRFVVYEYEGGLQGKPLWGIALLGFDLQSQTYQMAWADSFHMATAQMFCVGKSKDNGFWVLGSYDDPSGGPAWGWRTEFVLVDDRHLTVTAYNIIPDGLEAKAVETIYERID